MLTARLSAQAPTTMDLVLEEVTITASAGENVIGSSSTVSVIDRKAIDRFGYRSVSDALDGLAGISVQRTYLKQRMVTTRGILQDLYANKNLVMLDGVPLWHAVSGEHNLDRVGLAEVRRIEVLKGPASVIYGSQAYTGAVNIVLPNVGAGDREGLMYAGFGSGGQYEGGANIRYGTQKGLGVLVAANATRGQRFRYSFTDEANVRGTMTDYLDTSNLTFRATYRGHALLINRYDHREGFLGVAPTFAQGVNGRHEIEGAAIAYKVKEKIMDGWSFEGLAFYDWNERDYDRAVDHLKAAVDAFDRAGSDDDAVCARAALALALLTKNALDECGEVLLAAKPRLKRTALPRAVGELSHAEGTWLMQRGDFTASRLAFTKAIVAFRQIGDRFALGDTLVGLAQLLLRSQAPKRAWRLVRRAEWIFTDLDARGQLKRIQPLLNATQGLAQKR